MTQIKDEPSWALAELSPEERENLSEADIRWLTESYPAIWRDHQRQQGRDPEEDPGYLLGETEEWPG